MDQPGFGETVAQLKAEHLLPAARAIIFLDIFKVPRPPSISRAKGD